MTERVISGRNTSLITALLFVMGSGCGGVKPEAISNVEETATAIEEEPKEESKDEGVPFPDNAVGHRGREFVELVAAADKTAVEHFVSTTFAKSFRDFAPMDFHVQVIASIWEQSPGLVLRQVVVTNEYEAEFYLQSSTDQSWMRFSISVEKEAPHMIDGVMFRPADGPPDPEMANIDPEAVTGEQRSKIVAKVNTLMGENYVDEEVGVAAGQYLMEALEKGEYDDVSKLDVLAEKLTADLQKVTKDKHVRVRQAGPPPPDAEKSEPAEPPTNLHGLEKVEVLPGNIGYIDLRFFAPAKMAKEAIADAMKTIENTDAVIFDMRKNGGGAPDGVQNLCSYLFDTKVHLNSLYWREGDNTVEFWTLDEVDGKKRPNVPVFVLTSDRTFSGAEEFTYNLQTRKRATIVGQTTGGGANPGGMFDLTPTLGIFIATGKAINPVTNTNWEGVGVKPDVKVKAEKALKKAKALAKKAARKYRKSK